jgi:hypothetical protein
MPLFLKAGGAEETDEKIDYVTFSQNFETTIQKQMRLHL